MTAGTTRGRDLIPLREATRAWFAISLQTFGGPAGQIAVMQHKLVDEKRWIGQRRFLHALNYCMLLPGPEAQQLAIYTGWLLNGALGGLIAGVLFVLPGMLALLGLTILYLAAGDTTVVVGLFAGLAPAVIAIVVQAVYRVGTRALGHRVLVALAVAAFLALAVLGVPFPVVILAAGAAGWVASRRVPALRALRPHAGDDGPEPLIRDDALHTGRPSLHRSLGVLLVGLVAWFAPVVAVAALLGRHSVYVDEGLFFAGAAVVTFGGAYAVLAYVAQQAVEVHGWLAPGEMVHGLALAETTPGPLIMVTQWTAGVGAYRDPGALDPWAGMLVGSLLTTWVTFVPCFLFIFLGAPYVERLRHNTHLTGALAGVTAAVVGVIASLAVFFSLHTLFDDTRTLTAGPLDLELPVWRAWDPLAFALTAVALALILWRRWSPLRTLGVSALLGLVTTLVGVPGTSAEASTPPADVITRAIPAQLRFTPLPGRAVDGAPAHARRLTSRSDVDLVGWQESERSEDVLAGLRRRGWETRFFDRRGSTPGADAVEDAVSWRTSTFAFVSSSRYLRHTGYAVGARIHLASMAPMWRRVPGTGDDNFPAVDERRRRPAEVCSPGRSRTYVASPDSKSGGPCRQTNRGSRSERRDVVRPGRSRSHTV